MRGGKFSWRRAFWQLPEIGGEGGVRGLGLYIAVLVGLQYTGTLPTVSLYKQLEPFAEVAGLAIGDPAGQRFSSTEQQQYTTITTIGHEC